jgi:signal transduction histidine kinase
LKSVQVPAPASLLGAVDELCRSLTLAELAADAALLTQKLIVSEEVRVLIRTADGEFLAGNARPSGPLDSWASALLEQEHESTLATQGQLLAAYIDAEQESVHGVLGVMVPNTEDLEIRETVTALAQLVSTCSAHLVGHARASRVLVDAQKSLGKGLHDLRTPLNSLRLGLHLLEPGLVTQDPAIVQRTHRAVDRMAVLVTEMFDALHGRSSEGA